MKYSFHIMYSKVQYVLYIVKEMHNCNIAQIEILHFLLSAITLKHVIFLSALKMSIESTVCHAIALLALIATNNKNNLHLNFKGHVAQLHLHIAELEAR